MKNNPFRPSSTPFPYLIGVFRLSSLFRKSFKDAALGCLDWGLLPSYISTKVVSGIRKSAYSPYEALSSCEAFKTEST